MPLGADLIYVEPSNGDILQNPLSQLLVVVEIANLFSISIHEYVVPHFKNGDGPAQEEFFNSESLAPVIELRSKALLRERLKNLVLHVPVDDGAIEAPV